MIETNKSHAAKLAQLAVVYEDSEVKLHPLGLNIHVTFKEELVALMKAIGGRFRKDEGDSFVYFRSQRLDGVAVVIWKDTVCEKVVTYKCKPILSPEEEAELMEVANA